MYRTVIQGWVWILVWVKKKIKQKGLERRWICKGEYNSIKRRGTSPTRRHKHSSRRWNKWRPLIMNISLADNHPFLPTHYRTPKQVVTLDYNFRVSPSKNERWLLTCRWKKPYELNSHAIHSGIGSGNDAPARNMVMPTTFILLCCFDPFIVLFVAFSENLYICNYLCRIGSVPLDLEGLSLSPRKNDW